MSEKKYEYFLFDWDGTLAQTHAIWEDVYRRVFADYGVTGVPTKEIFAHHGDWEIPKYFGIRDVVGCVERIANDASARLNEVKLYDGVKETLSDIRERHLGRLALISNTMRETLYNGLAYSGLTPYFDVFIGKEDVVMHKPDPEALNTALKLMDGDLASAVMIGDSSRDIDAANNAGIDSVLIHQPDHAPYYDLNELKTHGPTYVVDGIKELRELVVEV